MMQIETKIANMLKMISATNEHECDCTHVYTLMDEIAEEIERGVDLSASMPEIHHHLEMCKCCEGELEALRKILAAGELA